MKIKKRWIESLLYWVMCLISFGAIWLLRILITESIRMAFDDGEPNTNIFTKPLKFGKK